MTVLIRIWKKQVDVMARLQLGRKLEKKKLRQSRFSEKA